jgi:3-deoxy-D-manno-octulosonic-acid transferase
LKFDAVKIEERRVMDVQRLLRQVGAPKNARLLVAGSTHAGEERILGEIYVRLRKTFPDLFLVVVPRHMERGKEAGRELSACGVRFIYRKEIGLDSQYKPGEVDCLLVNTSGELNYFYEHAHLVFVGKSLTAEGGQNPIEPAAFSKPIVFGPHMENFEAVAKAFTSGNGALQVSSAEELEAAFHELLANPGKAAELGRNALKVVHENSGSVERTVDMIVSHIADRSIYVAAKRNDIALV